MLPVAITQAPSPARSLASPPPRPQPHTADSLLALADRCVQCGLCLPACPTYGSDRIEAESPRGRIALARAWALRTVEATAIGDAHLDHCLGCRSCEAVCPAGVEYGELLVNVRGLQRQRRMPGWRQRAGEWLAAHPRRLHAMLGLYRRLHRWLPQSLRPLPVPPCPPVARVAPLPAPADAAVVALFVGCVAGPYEATLREATIRMLATLGIAAVQPAGQTCCGSLHSHAGDPVCAGALADTNRSAFAGVSTVLTLASGCHESVARSVPDTARVVDAIDFLDQHASRLHFVAHPASVALHLPCTQRNVVGSVPALRRLLARVPGLQVHELDGGYGCCGAAGLNLVTQPERAAGYRQPLLEQLAASGASRLLSANIGCRLHLANAARVPVQHPLELLGELLQASSPARPSNAAWTAAMRASPPITLPESASP